MNIAITIISAILVFVWIISNIATAKTCSAKEMRRCLIQGQCLVGRIFANLFYAPAWILKGIRFVVLATIK